MGTSDRIIRALVAIAIGILYFTNVITGALSVILMIAAIVFLLTSFVSVCPLYGILGTRTNKDAK